MIGEELRLNGEKTEEMFNDTYIVDKINEEIEKEGLTVEEKTGFFQAIKNIKHVKEERLDNLREKSEKLHAVYKGFGCSREDMVDLLLNYKDNKKIDIENALRDMAFKNVSLTAHIMSELKDKVVEEYKEDDKYKVKDEEKREKMMNDSAASWLMNGSRLYYKDVIDSDKYNIVKGYTVGESIGLDEKIESVAKLRAKMAVEKSDLKFNIDNDLLSGTGVFDVIVNKFTRTLFENYDKLQKLFMDGSKGVLKVVHEYIHEKGEEKLKEKTEDKMIEGYGKFEGGFRDKFEVYYKMKDDKIDGNLETDFDCLKKVSGQSYDINLFDPKYKFSKGDNFKEFNGIIGGIEENSFMIQDILKDERIKERIPDDELIKLECIYRQAFAMYTACYHKNPDVFNENLTCLKGAVSGNTEFKENNTIGERWSDDKLEKIRKLEKTIKFIELYQKKEKLEKEEVNKVEKEFNIIKKGVDAELENMFMKAFSKSTIDSVTLGFEVIGEILRGANPMTLPILPARLLYEFAMSRYFDGVDSNWDDIYDLTEVVAVGNNKI